MQDRKTDRTTHLETYRRGVARIKVVRLRVREGL